MLGAMESDPIAGSMDRSSHDICRSAPFLRTSGIIQGGRAESTGSGDASSYVSPRQFRHELPNASAVHPSRPVRRQFAPAPAGTCTTVTSSSTIPNYPVRAVDRGGPVEHYRPSLRQAPKQRRLEINPNGGRHLIPRSQRLQTLTTEEVVTM